jgi:hypothetical protein
VKGPPDDIREKLLSNGIKVVEFGDIRINLEYDFLSRYVIWDRKVIGEIKVPDSVEVDWYHVFALFRDCGYVP